MSQTQTSSELMQRALSCEHSASESARRGPRTTALLPTYRASMPRLWYSSRSALFLVLISVGNGANSLKEGPSRIRTWECETHIVCLDFATVVLTFESVLDCALTSVQLAPVGHAFSRWCYVWGPLTQRGA